MTHSMSANALIKCWAPKAETKPRKSDPTQSYLSRSTCKPHACSPGKIRHAHLWEGGGLWFPFHGPTPLQFVSETTSEAHGGSANGVGGPLCDMTFARSSAMERPVLKRALGPLGPLLFCFLVGCAV